MILLRSVLIFCFTIVAARPSTNASIRVELPNRDDKSVKFAVKILNNDNKTARCSGSIISPHFVVTACLYCLWDVEGLDKLLVANGDFHNPRILHHYFNVKSVHLHELCDDEPLLGYNYNIGLVQTYQQFMYGPDVQPARILNSYDTETMNLVYTFYYDTTYGHLIHHPDVQQVPGILGSYANETTMLVSTFLYDNLWATRREESVRVVEVIFTNLDKCQRALAPYITDMMLCTTYDKTLSIKNLPDMGSPLHFDDGLLVGMFVSSGILFPVAVHMPFYHGVNDWIRSTVAKESHGKERID